MKFIVQVYRLRDGKRELIKKEIELDVEEGDVLDNFEVVSAEFGLERIA